MKAQGKHYIGKESKMKKQQLDEAIKELRAELKKTEAADDQAQEHIQILLKEIDVLIQ